MGFWIFMLVIVLLIPLTLTGFGAYFSKTAPKNINTVFGYRTSMSMKNMDTWIFAHKYIGKIWLISGLILLPLSVLLMLLILSKSLLFISNFGGALCGVQIIFMLIPVILTEKALKKVFDKNGNRRGKYNI